MLYGSAFRPVAAGLQLLATIIALHPQDFTWLPYPTAANGPGYGHFDLLSGRLDLRTQLTTLSFARATTQISQWTTATGWAERVHPYLCYA